MNALPVPSKPLSLSIAPNVVAIAIDHASGNMRVSKNVKWPLSRAAAFSLVEVTLALGIAAFCLLTVFALVPVALKTQQASIKQTTANEIISQIYSFLRADVRLPPGQANKVCGDPPDPNQPCQWDNLHGHWRNVALPDTLYFTNEGNPPRANETPVFRAKITYRAPPSETTSLADIRVTWPAQVDPDLGGVPAGSVTATIAVNR